QRGDGHEPIIRADMGYGSWDMGVGFRTAGVAYLISHIPYPISGFQTFPSARRTRSGVKGWAVTRALNGERASLIAFMTAPGAPAVPASPAPFAPSSEVVVGVETCATTMSGISPAIG